MTCNIVFTLACIFSGITLPGLSYLFAAVFSVVLSTYYLYKKTPIIDFLIFNRV